MANVWTDTLLNHKVQEVCLVLCNPVKITRLSIPLYYLLCIILLYILLPSISIPNLTYNPNLFPAHLYSIDKSLTINVRWLCAVITIIQVPWMCHIMFRYHEVQFSHCDSINICKIRLKKLLFPQAYYAPYRTIIAYYRPIWFLLSNSLACY